MENGYILKLTIICVRLLYKLKIFINSNSKRFVQFNRDLLLWHFLENKPSRCEGQ